MTLKRRNEDGTYDTVCGQTVIVNNLNSDSGTQALSAAQGKVLNDKVSALTMQIYNLIYPVGYKHLGFQAPAVPDGSTVKWELRSQYDGKLTKIYSTLTTGATGGDAKHTHSLGYNAGACIAWTWNAQESNMLLGITGDAGSCGVSFQSSSKMPCSGYSTVYKNNIQCVPLRGKTDETTIDPPYVVVKVWERTA